MSLSAAEAWCWVARMLRAEADALSYAWPRVEGSAEQAHALEQDADACFLRAQRLDPDEALWARALAKWESP